MARVLVTGVAGSIGVPLAAHFLERGDEVTGLDVRQPTLPDGIDASAFRFHTCDLAAESEVEATLGPLLQSGAYDVVVNNVGLIYSALTVGMAGGKPAAHDFADWRRVIDVTLSAAFFVSSLCAKRMIETATPGVIVNISSICATGNRGQAAYSAAKAGINAMTVSMAKELGPFGIRVGAIAPGFMNTESTLAAVPEKHLKATVGRIPLGRLGEVAELLGAVDFVVGNGYFNGKVLELDGGLTL